MSFCDCHCHTERSACAEDVSLEWYSTIGAAMGQAFVVTDHSAHLYAPADRMWAFWTPEGRSIIEAYRSQGDAALDRYIEDVRAMQSGRMLLGIELDMFIDGTPVCNPDRMMDFDVIVGAAHSFPALQAEAEVACVFKEYKTLVRHLMRWGIDVLAHPFRPICLKGYEISDDIIDWLVDIAGEWDVALEINSHNIWRQEDVKMANLALERGVALSVGTDAHRISEFGDFSYHREIADVLGACADDLYWYPSEDLYVDSLQAS